MLGSTYVAVGSVCETARTVSALANAVPSRICANKQTILRCAIPQKELRAIAQVVRSDEGAVASM